MAEEKTLQMEADGFKGRKNIYTCSACNRHIVTVDRDDGTTPMMLQCRATAGCKGYMESSFYTVPPDCGPATFEWYIPSLKEALALKPAARDHVSMGGLLIRALLPADVKQGGG